MITQEILNTFIYQTKSGKFGVTEPVELDSILGMITQEILDTFIYQTKSGKFGVTEPVELDSILGMYDTYEEAEKIFREYVEKENIIFE